MINIQTSKPVELLKNFDKSELKQFEHFLKSGFLAKSPLMELILQWMIKYHPTFQNAKFTSSHLSKRIFPKDKAIKEQKLRKKLSEFSKLILSFISITELRNDNSLQEKLQAKFLLYKSDHPNFFKLRQGSLRRMEQKSVRDSNYYLENNFIYEQLYDYSIQRNLKPEIEYLHKASDNLDRFYYLKKIEYYCSKVSLNQLFKEESKDTFEIIDLEKIKSQYSDDSVFHLYFKLIELNNSQANTALFNNIFKYFKAQFETLSIFQRKFVLSQLLNYTFGQVKRKKSIYLRKQFELYTFGLEHDIYIDGQYISDKNFLNINFSASLNKKFDLVDQLIHKYGHLLAPSDREKAIMLCKSFSEFHKGNYQKAYDLVMHINDASLHYQLRTRLLSIRCLYHIHIETDDYIIPLKSQIKNFDNYILREKSLSDTNRSSYANFNKILKKIIALNKKRITKKDKESLIQKINNYPVIIAKDWLLKIIKTVQ